MVQETSCIRRKQEISGIQPHKLPREVLTAFQPYCSVQIPLKESRRGEGGKNSLWVIKHLPICLFLLKSSCFSQGTGLVTYSPTAYFFSSYPTRSTQLRETQTEDSLHCHLVSPRGLHNHLQFKTKHLFSLYIIVFTADLSFAYLRILHKSLQDPPGAQVTENSPSPFFARVKQTHTKISL